MKALHRKLLILLLSVISVVCLAFGLAACNPGDSRGGNDKKLVAPVVSLTDDVISWEEVENADSYEIFEDGISVSNQTELTYRIPEKEMGKYVYTVKAKCDKETYFDSDFSEGVTFNVVRLAKPALSLEGKVISWGEVENADSYEIYQNEVCLNATQLKKYDITESYPGLYNYYVRAVSENHAFAKSEPSEIKKYSVPLVASISIKAEEDFSAEEVSINLSGENIQPMVEISTKENEMFSLVEFTIALDTGDYGTYIAKAVELPEGYTSTWARVTSDNNLGEITILKTDKYDEIQLGNSTITAGTFDDKTQKVFIAPESAKYSVRVDEKDDLSIYIGDNLLASVTDGLEVGIIEAGEGETILLSFCSEEGGEYSIELVKGELPQYLRIGRFYTNPQGDPVFENYNYISGSCTRYIKVSDIDAGAQYKIMFFTATLGNGSVKFTIGDEKFEFFSGVSDLVLPLSTAKEIDDNGVKVNAIKIDIEVKGAATVSCCIYDSAGNG